MLKYIFYLSIFFVFLDFYPKINYSDLNIQKVKINVYCFIFLMILFFLISFILADKNWKYSSIDVCVYTKHTATLTSNSTKNENLPRNFFL